MAQKRQVADAKIALQHNLGLGGACVIAMYKKYTDGIQKSFRKDQSADPAVLEQFEAESKQAKL